jgi:tetratricopeptide (TPR) repeat protein
MAELIDEENDVDRLVETWLRSAGEGPSMIPRAVQVMRTVQGMDAERSRAALQELLPTLDPKDRKTVRSVLSDSLEAEQRWSEAAAVAKAAVDEMPDDLGVCLDLYWPLLLSVGPDEAERVAATCRSLIQPWIEKERKRLEEKKKTLNEEQVAKITHWFSQDLLRQKNRATGDLRAELNRLKELPAPDASELNSRGWFALILGEATDAALHDVEESIQRDKGGISAALHTRAAILAEMGRAWEARDALRDAMRAGDRAKPDEDDWYVLGRICELYGATDAARRAYEKLQEPKSRFDVPTSSWVLAQRRLKGLPSAAPAAPPVKPAKGKASRP